jgi:N-acyl-D-aspartate/D-glutamate deacylase
VREEKIMTLEQAVKRLTFDNANVFGIYDRGVLRPGMAADMVLFDPDTINVLPEEPVYDLPKGNWRLRELASGIDCTVVNGKVLIENGKPTGATPGRMLRNSYYQQQRNGGA